MGPLVTVLIILLTVAFVPLAVAETTVLHLHDSKSGLVTDETAPSPKSSAQQVAATCTFLGPAATSTFSFPPGTYAYVIFATGPEFLLNRATVTIEVFRSALKAFGAIPSIAPKKISGGGCPPTECIIKNEDRWAVPFEVTLNPGDQLAVIIASTNEELRVLVDGSQADPRTKQDVFTDSIMSISGSDSDGSAVGGSVVSVDKLDLLAPWVALFGVVGVFVSTAIVAINKTEKN